MSATTTHTDKIGAADKSIGFDFQYFYFLNCLLNLKDGESVGLEVKDDVHTDLKNDRQILVQTKHTVQKAASGDPINITTYDSDLWKTMYNWSMVIEDSSAGRSSTKARLEFVNRTTFIIATNKAGNAANKFFQLLDQCAEKDLHIDKLKLSLETLKKGTTDAKIIGYITKVLELDDKVLKAFFDKIMLESDLKDIITVVKESIKAKMVPINRIEDTYNQLDSTIRTDNFISISSGQPIIVTFSEFYKRYRRIFDIARSPKLYIRKDMPILPDNIKDQIFITQLVDIGDIANDDDETIASYTLRKINMINNLETWYQEGEITDQEREGFHAEAKNRWEIRFRTKYRKPVDEPILAAKALEIIDESRLDTLSVSDTDLPIDLSNGEYYHLSDIPEIGWHKDWEGKYKK